MKKRGSFLKRVQNSAGVKKVRAKIRKAEILKKKLSREYRTAIKKASKKLSK